VFDSLALSEKHNCCSLFNVSSISYDLAIPAKFVQILVLSFTCYQPLLNFSA
jgi:hypothetical protein